VGFWSLGGNNGDLGRGRDENSSVMVLWVVGDGAANRRGWWLC
jgi:hypothetical protein